MAREINAIVVHGSWTKPGLNVDADEIRKWHVEGNGWSDIGYHFVIRRDGVVEDGRPVNTPGAHVADHNKDTIGICLVGGRADDNPSTVNMDEFTKQELLWEFNYTEKQMKALGALVDKLQAKHACERVVGHRDFPNVTKRCPGFEVREYFGV
jgi:N-acetyl-anhydromuramyl-L-alanine amidase AmpD